MSYGIIRVQKFKAGSVRGIQIHDQREKDHSHTNKDIDFEKSNLNYDLYNQQHINFYQKVKERITELNLKKAVRKDAVVMCQCLITSDYEFFENMSKSKQNKFFKDAYSFVAEKYGKQNIISATVHFDERTPHIHINFVPVTSDGRLCAKDLFKKQDLVKLHDDFYKFNQSKGYDLKRGEGKEEYQKHLTVEELKIKTQKEIIELEESELIKSRMSLGEEKLKLKKKEICLRDLEEEVDIKLQYATKVLNSYNNLRIFEPEKVTFQSDKLKINKSDYEKLKALADIGLLEINAKKENKKLKREIKNLKIKCDDLEEKSKVSVTKKIKDIQQQNFELNKLNNKIKFLENLINGVNKYFDKNNLAEDFNNYFKELENQKTIKYEKNSNWDLER